MNPWTSRHYNRNTHTRLAVLKTAAKLQTVPMPADSAPSELARAAVRQILWAPWLSGGGVRGGWMILMSGGLHLYTRHLVFTAVDRPNERHLLCACLHNKLRQV